MATHEPQKMEADPKLSPIHGHDSSDPRPQSSSLSFKFRRTLVHPGFQAACLALLLATTTPNDPFLVKPYTAFEHTQHQDKAVVAKLTPYISTTTGFLTQIMRECLLCTFFLAPVLHRWSYPGQYHLSPRNHAAIATEDKGLYLRRRPWVTKVLGLGAYMFGYYHVVALLTWVIVVGGGVDRHYGGIIKMLRRGAVTNVVCGVLNLFALVLDWWKAERI